MLHSPKGTAVLRSEKDQLVIELSVQLMHRRWGSRLIRRDTPSRLMHYDGICPLVADGVLPLVFQTLEDVDTSLLHFFSVVTPIPSFVAQDSRLRAVLAVASLLEGDGFRVLRTAPFTTQTAAA